MRGTRTTLFVLLLLLITTVTLFSQDGSLKPSRTEAEAAWANGNYEIAFQHYNGLLLLFSRDPSYSYYTGACLVKLQRDIPRAVTLLGSAIKSSVNIKTVPDDVWFYYGRALQMNGAYTQATDAFNKFIKTAGKKVAQNLEVQRYLDECVRGIGGQSSGLRGQGSEFSAQAPKPEVLRQEKSAYDSVSAAAVNNTALPAVTKENITVPEDYDIKLTKAVKMQFAADSLLRVAQGVRRVMETVDVKEPLRLRAENLEKEAAAMQAEADKIFLTLEPGEQPVVKTEVKTEVTSEDKAEGKVGKSVDRSDEKEPLFSVFDVYNSPAYGESNPIPLGKGAPEGLVYRVQLAAFKNPVAPAFFKGLYPLYARVKPENGVTYFYAGMFRTLADAKEALPKVRTSGFKDAFIVAFNSDVQVSMERAALLEKDWGKKPLLYLESKSPGKENYTLTDTIPVGTLSFRAEVLRSKKPVKPEVTQKIELLAGSRGLEIIKNNQGETLYLVGKFITFESAEEYVSLLVRNGYSEAKVAAYVGTNEIPVEAAKELLNKLLND